jgi:NADH:ubiquinone oxidoreductase subunit E
MSKNIRALSARQRDDKTLFEAITEAAQATGTPSHEQLCELSRQRLVSGANLLGTTSFYDFLRAENCGKRAYVCSGTSCMLLAKQAQARQTLLQQLSEDEIGEVACLGHCYHGGACWHGDKTYDAVQGAESDDQAIPFYSTAAQSVFTTAISDLDGYYQQLLLEPEKILSELAASRLRGRGGAGFPFADKLKSCAGTTAEQKYVVCNGDEGDPGAFSDRYLLEEQPQRVLAGMLAAAHAVGADSAYLYIRAEYPQAQRRVEQAIEQFEQTTAYTTSRLRFRVICGAGSYICGEETALLNSIEGLRPEVRIRPPLSHRGGAVWQTDATQQRGDLCCAAVDPATRR